MTGKRLWGWVMMAVVAGGVAQGGTGVYEPRDYVWTSQSKNSSESMPVGGHDIGMNVWVENGELLVYMCQSGWFDENNTLLKAGRLRLTTDDGVLGGRDFRQELRLRDGMMRVSCGDMNVEIWADTESPDIFIDIKGNKKRHIKLSYESWRQRDRQVPSDASQQITQKWLITPDVTTYADSIWAGERTLRFRHVNRAETVFDMTVKIEGLETIKDKLYNPIGGLKMEGEMTTGDLRYTGTSEGKYMDTDYRAWNYEGDVKATTAHVRLTAYDETAMVPKMKESRKRSAAYWKAFWQRSYIQLEREMGAKVEGRTEADEPQATDSAAVILRNYELFRYMLGCNAKGLWPTKFNGGLFTFDPSWVDGPRKFTPDYRCWGGGTMTAQNQRLVYWPMVKSGDLEMLRVQLDTYARMYKSAKARVGYYWGHDGCAFTEQMENCGLPNPAEYGEHSEGQDRGVESNAWLEYLWDTSLEFCMMALEANRYQAMDISAYEEMIWQCLVFFDEHYQYVATRLGKEPLTDEGKIVIYPGSGAETHKMAYNPCSTVAALRVVGSAWVEYAERMGKDSTVVERGRELVSHVPEIPMREIEGRKVISPAVAWARINNVETTQMYPVFPWRVYGVGREGLEIARDTWLIDPWSIKMRSARGWKQDNIWAACLGLSDYAAALNYEKMANGPYRFPAFFDMGFDWAPDFNRGGSGMIGVQEMLMQRGVDGRRMELPAWPERWGKVVYRLY